MGFATHLALMLPVLGIMVFMFVWVVKEFPLLLVVFVFVIVTLESVVGMKLARWFMKRVQRHIDYAVLEAKQKHDTGGRE